MIFRACRNPEELNMMMSLKNSNLTLDKVTFQSHSYPGLLSYLLQVNKVSFNEIMKYVKKKIENLIWCART